MQSKIDGGEIMATWLEKEIEEKRKEGIYEGKRVTAVKLLENGVDIDIIVKSTDLPKEEIEKLAETIH